MLLSKRIQVASKFEDWHSASISDPNSYAVTQDAFCFNNFCQTASGKIFAFNRHQQLMAVSTDNGKHWVLSVAPNNIVNNASTMYNDRIKGITSSFYDTVNDRIYVGARNIMYSDDDGVTWNVIAGTSVTSLTTNQWRSVTQIKVIEDRASNSSLCTFAICVDLVGTHYVRCESSNIPTYIASNSFTVATSSTAARGFFNIFSANITLLCTVYDNSQAYVSVYNTNTGATSTKELSTSNFPVTCFYYNEDNDWLFIGSYCARSGTSGNYTYTPCPDMMAINTSNLLNTGTLEKYPIKLLVEYNNAPYLKVSFLRFNSITKIDGKFFICVSHQFDAYEDYDIHTAGAGENIGCVLCAEESSLDTYGSTSLKLDVKALNLPDSPYIDTFKVDNNTIIQGSVMVGSSSTNHFMQTQYGFQPPVVYYAEDIYQDVTKYKYLDQTGLQEIHDQMMDYISEVTQ